MSTNTVTVEFAKRINHPFPLLSWIIQCVEGTNFSHVALKIDAGANRKFIYHSHLSGVNFLSEKLYRSRYQSQSTYKFDITLKHRKRLITWFLDNAGEEYPLTELAGILIVRLADKLFGWKIKNPLGSKKMYCSEAAVQVLKIVGVKLPKAEYKVTGLKEITEIMDSISK